MTQFKLNSFCRAMALAQVLLLAGPTLRAQTVGWLPRLQLDNDAYNFWIDPGSRTDEQYTNGVVVSLETMRAPWWGRRFAPGTPGCVEAASREGACVATIVSIAQDLYTPNLNRPPFSEPNWEQERPYAAWLRVSATARIASPGELREVEIAAGVTGKPALGQVAQSIAHAVAGAYTHTATGWETQVGFQPGVLASYHQTWLVARSELGRGFALDFSPYAGGTVGNILTEADAGAKARIGWNLSHPWDPRAWGGRPHWEAFAYAGGRCEYVLEDFSLDGTLFGGGRHVTRVPGVGEHEIGGGLRYDRWSIGYRALSRSREYASGPLQHTFSSMIVSYGWL